MDFGQQLTDVSACMYPHHLRTKVHHQLGETRGQSFATLMIFRGSGALSSEAAAIDFLDGASGVPMAEKVVFVEYEVWTFAERRRCMCSAQKSALIDAAFLLGCPD